MGLEVKVHLFLNVVPDGDEIYKCSGPFPSMPAEIARNLRFVWETGEELHEEGKRIIFVYPNVPYILCHTSTRCLTRHNVCDAHNMTVCRYCYVFRHIIVPSSNRPHANYNILQQ